MLNTQSEHIRQVTGKVGEDPRFAATIHDDSAAQQFGFKSALVGGSAVASFMCHLFVEAWGEEWLRHGVLVERQRRPVYEGQPLTVLGSAIRTADEGPAADATLRNAEGEDVAFATGSLPRVAPVAPDLRLYPHRPHPAEPLFVPPGGHRPGDLYGSTPFVYTSEIHEDYLDRVAETLPIFRRDGVVHPGYLIKATMHDGDGSFRRATPGVHLGVTVEHYDIAHVGDTLSTSGHLTKVYEKNGNHYMESDQLVVANGARPLAMVRRTSIYTFGDKRRAQ